MSKVPTPATVTRSLRHQLLLVLGVSLSLLLACGVAGLFLLVRDTEQTGWAGRQHEATQRVVHAVSDFLQQQQGMLRIINLFGHDELAQGQGSIALLQREHPILMEIVQLDQNGDILAHYSNDQGVLANLFTIPQSTWFLSAHAGTSYIGDLQLSATDHPYLIFSIPANQGGVLACRLRVDQLGQIVADLRLGEGGSAYLVNRDGQIITHSRPQTLPKTPDQAAVSALLPLYRNAGSGWHGHYRNLAGLEVIGTMAAVPGTPWIAVTELPADEAAAVSRQALVLMLTSAGIMLAAGALVISLLLKRQFLDPLARLQQGVGRISQGDLDNRVIPTGPAEIRELAQAFNLMAERLQQREQQSAEQAAALADGEARYRAIVEDQSELICRTLPTGQISFANEALCRFFGHDRQELLGRDFSLLLPPEALAARATILAGLTAASPVASLEFSLDRPDQPCHWLHWTERAIYDEQGRCIEYAGVGSDITKRRLAEEALQRAKEEAEEANAAKSLFLANMSHEIRTPMNGILGMTHLAMETDDADRRQRFLTTVQQSAEGLLGLLGDILDFSKMETGQFELHPAPFALTPLLESVGSTLAVQAAERGLTLEVDIDPTLPARMLGDGLRIRQILLNLGGNAIKFTPAGSVTIAAALEPPLLEDAPAGLHLRVIDTGIGIPREKLPLIFNRFEQVDNSYARQYGGAGLGLAICSQLTTLMEGRIWAESEENQGSVFHCLLPLHPCHEEKDDTPAETAAPPATGLRILVVDDNEVNRDVASMILERDHVVTTAANGIEALVSIAFGRFDVVLMDVQMPLLDGLATTTIIRTIEAGKPLSVNLPEQVARILQVKLEGGHLPIVAITAHAMGGDEEICLDSGMDAYLTKPFDPNRINHMLAEVIRSGAAHTTRSSIQTNSTSAEEVATPPATADRGEVLAYLRDHTGLSAAQSEAILIASLTSITQQMTAVNQALSTGDADALATALHTLKGTLLQCGLQPWATLAEQIHSTLTLNPEAPVTDRLGQLNQLRTALATFLSTNENGHD